MTFLNGPYPPPEHQLDPSSRYAADAPFDLKQAKLTHQRHRWFQILNIGSSSGPYSVASTGLAAGGTMRVQFDHRPDMIIVAISGQTANTGRVAFYYGEAGGPYVLLGPLGKAIVPAPEGGIITLVNVGSTATYGNVVACAGFEGNPGIDIVSGQ